LKVFLKALEKFIKSGKIRHIGMSNETPYGLSKYLRNYQKIKIYQE
jgi:aryl-alcohol dehydrogenase-like predicted oxidoreductase